MCLRKASSSASLPRLDPYWPESVFSEAAAASYTCGPGKKFGTPIEKLMMSRPAALSALAFSATAMMALGLARPMRLASWSIAYLGSGRGSARRGNSGREILTQRKSPTPGPCQRTELGHRLCCAGGPMHPNRSLTQAPRFLLAALLVIAAALAPAAHA